MSDTNIDGAASKEPAAPTPAAPAAPAPAPAPIVLPAAVEAKPAPIVAAAPAASADLATLQAAATEVQRVREEIAKAHQAGVDERRLAKLRSMGLVVDGKTYTEAEVLERAPKDDPQSPGAEAAFEAFRAARPGFFKSREPSIADRIAGITALQQPRFKDTKILSYTKLAEGILRGGGR